MQEINTPENRQLLINYLKAELGEEKAWKFLSKNQDRLFTKHGVAWSLGKRNLEFFCMFFLSDIFSGAGKAPLAPIHYEIWAELQDIIINKSCNQQNYILPRGTGKSTFITLALSIWCSLYQYKHFTVICSAIGDTAESFIRNIRMAVQDNAKIEACFGEVYNTKKYINNSEKIEFGTGCMIQSISAASTLRGKSYGNIRVELALLDDFQKDDEVTTDDQRQKKWKKFNDDINYAMQKDNSTIIAVGTLQCKEDFYYRLKNSPVWKTRQEKGVLVPNVDELYNTGYWKNFKSILTDKSNEYRLDYAKDYYLQNIENMQYPLLWPEYWDCFDYAISYYGNPASFKQEVQGDIDNIGTKKFTTIITESPEAIESHTFNRTVLSVDPAGTQRKSKKHDYYAFCVTSKSDGGITYVRKGEIRDFEFTDYVDHVIEILKDYPDINTVSIEKQTYGGSDVIRLQELIKEDLVLRGRGLTFINEARRGNKDDRINMIVGEVNLGQIIFNENDTEAIGQLSEFAGCDYSLHDDFPDCLADSLQRLRENKPIPKLQVYDLSILGL